MPRLYAPLAALLLLIACSTGRSLHELAPTARVEAVERDPEPPVGGKGFVSARADALAPPISLTASDGSGLRMLSLQATAMIDEPLATTELELRFQNPRDEIIEGKLELVLPPGASITRFAMLVGATWQEAEVVERQEGREVYETFLHGQRDPALLEQETGNRFGVRVFPIPAAGEARLRVSYVQTLEEPTHPYRLALRGLPTVGEIDARVGTRRAGADEVTWTELRLERQRPHEDLVVARDAPASWAWRSGRHVIARVTMPAADHGAAPPGSLAILFDTSASRAVDFAAKVEQLRAVVEQLGRHVDPAARLVVLPFDQSVGTAVYSGPLSGFADSDAPATLLRRQALGASNLELALLAAAEQRVERVIVITDGMITAGEREPAALRAVLERVAEAGTRRLDVVAGRDRRDDEVLRTLVTSALPQAGVVIDAARSPEEVALRLVRPTAPPTEVRIAGAKRAWPAVLRGMHAGDAALVYAEVEGPARSLSVTLEPEGMEPVQQRLEVVDSKGSAFVQAWVRADVAEQLAELAATGDARDPALRGKLAALSVEHRILNELTAFLVLETEADYARFGIERRHEGHEPGPSLDPGVAPPEVTGRQATMVGRSVSMEEFRNVPVGSSASREFVQVVESSATASRDSAGIRLGGSTGVELEPQAHAHVAGRPSFRRGVMRPRNAEVTLRSIRALGGLDEEDARAVAHAHRVDVRPCWFAAVGEGDVQSGTMAVELHIAPDGRVWRVDLLRDRVSASRALRACMNEALRARSFAPAAGERRARYTLVFRDGALPEAGPAPVDEAAPDRFDTGNAHAGNYAEVTRWLRRGEVERAASLAWAWRRSVPDDLLALVAVGEVAQAEGHHELAARAFGSIAELHPSDAAMLRFAAGRLETLGRAGLPLAIDVLRQAQQQRSDHPSSHQALAWALARRGRFGEAFEALAGGYDRSYPDGRFASARAELGEELRIIAAAWLRAQPKQRPTIEARLAELGLSVADEPSLRFVLTWETDVNDVDLHVEDGHGNRAWYSQPTLTSGGTLLADVTTGFGPESFVIDGEPAAYPYRLGVHYYSRGPMGYGMGRVQVIRHDGKGNLELEVHPFVVMNDQAKLEVGVVRPQ